MVAKLGNRLCRKTLVSRTGNIYFSSLVFYSALAPYELQTHHKRDGRAVGGAVRALQLYEHVPAVLLLTRLFRIFLLPKKTRNNLISVRKSTKVDKKRASRQQCKNVLRCVEAYKDLGDVVDFSLRFHRHVDIVVDQAGSMISNLLRSTVCRCVEFISTMCVTRVRSIITLRLEKSPPIVLNELQKH